ISYVVTGWLLTYPCFAAAVKGTPVSLRDIGAATWRPTLVGLMLAGAMLACKLSLAALGMVWMLLSSAVAGLLVFWILLQMWPDLRSDWEELRTTARTLRPAKARRRRRQGNKGGFD